MIRHTTQLNRVGTELAGLDGLHAMTDVTGFGLAGHLLEICRGSGLTAEVSLGALPLIESAVPFAQQGIVTGASGRNWAGYGGQIAWPQAAADWQRALVSDPQTSGGLLVTCSPDTTPAVLDAFRKAGFAQAAAIGALRPVAAGAAAGVSFAA